jgi:hypothetical protein
MLPLTGPQMVVQHGHQPEHDAPPRVSWVTVAWKELGATERAWLLLLLVGIVLLLLLLLLP